MIETRTQVIAQCRAVAHLANAVATVHREKVTYLEVTDLPDSFYAVVGEQTAAFMELLGEMLNAMDAANDEDAWLDPVFAEARLAREHGVYDYGDD